MTERTSGESEGADRLPTELAPEDSASRSPEAGVPMTQRMRNDPATRTDAERDDEVDPDVVPENVPRGGTTVPMPNDTGMTTPPISGWGETLVSDDDEHSD